MIRGRKFKTEMSWHEENYGEYRKDIRADGGTSFGVAVHRLFKPVRCFFLYEVISY
jgi:hypothetical protein